MSYWWNLGFGTDTSAYIDLRSSCSSDPGPARPAAWPASASRGRQTADQVVVLTQSEGVLVADDTGRSQVTSTAGTTATSGRCGGYRPVAACWVDFGPGRKVALRRLAQQLRRGHRDPPLNPDTAIRVPGSTAGVASWQPPASGGAIAMTGRNRPDAPRNAGCAQARASPQSISSSNQPSSWTWDIQTSGM